jgi:hypothetical protein
MLQPRFWFSAHLHIHWEVIIAHQDKYGETTAETKFLSLDKPIVGRGFLDIFGIIPRQKVKSQYDALKRVYSSMNKFCPKNFEVISDHDSESDSDTEMAEGEDSKDSTTEPEDKIDINQPTPQQVPVEETKQNEEEKKTNEKFTVRNDTISLDLEWLAILKVTHSLMPIGKKKFNFDEYVHPMQAGHHELLLKKEEFFKELKIEDLEIKKMTTAEIQDGDSYLANLKNYTENEFMNKQSVDYIVSI